MEMGKKPCQDQLFHPILVHCRKKQITKWGTPKKILAKIPCPKNVCFRKLRNKVIGMNWRLIQNRKIFS